MDYHRRRTSEQRWSNRTVGVGGALSDAVGLEREPVTDAVVVVRVVLTVGSALLVVAGCDVDDDTLIPSSAAAAAPAIRCRLRSTRHRYSLQLTHPTTTINPTTIGPHVTLNKMIPVSRFL